METWENTEPRLPLPLVAATLDAQDSKGSRGTLLFLVLSGAELLVSKAAGPACLGDCSGQVKGNRDHTPPWSGPHPSIPVG